MVTAVFRTGQIKTESEELYQYDYGQVLRIEGLTLPDAVEVHFSENEMNGEALIMVGATADGVTEVSIPNTLLTQGSRIHAWIYVREENSGETQYKITIPLKRRSEPKEFTEPEDEKYFEKVINTVSGHASDAQKAAQSTAADRTEVAQIAEAFTKQAQDAQTAIVSEGKTQVQAVKDEGARQLTSIADAGKAQLTAVNTAGDTQKTAIEKLGTEKVQDITTLGEEKTKEISDEGDTQVQKVRTEGENYNKRISAVERQILDIIAGNPTSWEMVRDIIAYGSGPDTFPIGTQFRTQHAEFGEIIWDVVAHDYDFSPDAVDEHSITLLTHDVVYNSIQFDSTEALYYCADELPAGTYHFTLLPGYDTAYGGGKTLQFTLTNPVPSGGVLMFPWGYNKQSTDTKISTYPSRESLTAIESVEVIEGTEGTNLGTADGKTAGMNHTHRMRYGSNNWEESAIRQFLNSDGDAGTFWTPQTIFDRPPSWNASTAGFIQGLPEDFLEVVTPCRHLTKTNGVYEIEGELSKAYKIEDRFWPPSYSELFGGGENGVSDGTQYPGMKTNADRIKYNSAGTARYYWMRSCNPWNASLVRSVNPDGVLYNSYANDSNGVPVACKISASAN